MEDNHIPSRALVTDGTLISLLPRQNHYYVVVYIFSVELSNNNNNNIFGARFLQQIDALLGK